MMLQGILYKISKPMIIIGTAGIESLATKRNQLLMQRANSKISSDGQRCISQEITMLHPAEYPPPRNVTLLILTKWGVLLKGKWSDEDCEQWLPIPKRSTYKPI